jgi:hydrogenase-4 component F
MILLSLTQLLPVVTVLLPLLGAALLLVPSLAPRARVLLLSIAVLDMVALLPYAMPRQHASFELGHFVVIDATSQLFLLLINALFIGIALHLHNRLRAAPELLPDIHRLIRLALVFMAAANAAILANHVVVGWVCLELTALAAVPMIHHQRRDSATSAAWHYFLFSAVSLGLVLLGVICLTHGIELTVGAERVSLFHDNLRLEVAIADPVWRRLGLALMIFGYASKLGMAPMYAWLPETYDAASPSVTTLLAAVQFNAVFVGLFRMLQVYGGIDADLANYQLTALGLASMLLATVKIVSTKNYKLLIAYAAINHAGVIAIGLALGKTAAYGVILYVVSNALVKAILFLTAGTIKAHYRTKTIEELHGMIREMRYSALFFLVGTFALLGFAPFGSFFGEVIIMTGLIAKGHFVTFGALCVLLSVVFIATGRSLFPMVWGEAKPGAKREPESLVALGPKLFYLAILLSLGVYTPAPLSTLLQQVAGSLGTR